MGTSPCGTECEGIEGTWLDGYVLGDGGLVAKAYGMDTMAHGEEHAAGLWPTRHILDEPMDGPVGKGMLANDDSFIQFVRLGAHLKVAIGKEP